MRFNIEGVARCLGVDEALRKCQGRHEHRGQPGPSAGGTAYPNERRPWTTGELKTLSTMRNEGADAVAAILGRSPKAVRRMASKAHVSLRVRPGDVCPVCGMREVRPHTSAGRHGMCPTCWTERLTRLREEEACQKRAEREYQAAKKRAQRA